LTDIQNLVRSVLVLSALLLAMGCASFWSGAWEDDPANWQRAFQSTKPDDVVVVHSLYWQPPGSGRKAGYLFEIAANPKLRDRLLTENRLIELEHAAAEQAKQLCVAACPSWFAPKDADAYEAWGEADQPHTSFRVLIDKATGTMFLSNYRV